jgi:hypothetical protein
MAIENPRTDADLHRRHFGFLLRDIIDQLSEVIHIHNLAFIDLQ